MHVIGHDHKLVQLNARMMPGYDLPAILGDASQIIQLRFTANDITENTLMIFDANRYEISARRSVIVPAQPNAASMMVLGIKGHRWYRCWMIIVTITM